MSDFELDTMLMFARRELGYAADEAAVAWAFSRLEKGDGTPGLLILGSLSPPFSSWEVDAYLRQALEELAVTMPARVDVLWWYARRVARQIVENPIQSTPELEANVRELAQLCIALDYPDELITLYGHDDFPPSSSGIFTEDDWRTMVVADAKELVEADSAGEDSGGSPSSDHD